MIRNIANHLECCRVREKPGAQQIALFG